MHLRLFLARCNYFTVGAAYLVHGKQDFYFDRIKETFQAFFNHPFEDFEFFGGWMLGFKDLKGPSGQTKACRVVFLTVDPKSFDF